MGTAVVASTKVRETGPRSASHGFRARLRTVNVGKTATQIMSASWCLLGGPTGRDGAASLVGGPGVFGRALGMTMLLLCRCCGWVLGGGGSRRQVGSPSR